MEGNQVVILQPHLKPRHFTWADGELRVRDVDAALERRALAGVLLPSLLYGEMCYNAAAPQGRPQ